jgi:hypothetical protein
MQRSLVLASVIALVSSCGGGASVPPDAPSDTRRLSTREIGNAVFDLTGQALPTDRFLEETYDTGYDNGPRSLTLQTDEAAALERSVSDVAKSVTAQHPERFLGACVPEQDGQAACIEAFLAGFAARAYRRPLAPEEAQALRALMTGTATGGGFALALEIAATAVLEAGPFLYREERGSVDGVHGRRLTPVETASALSFFVTGTMPDDTLVAAANGGRLATADDRRREAARLLATQGARADLREFVLEWLGVRGLGSVAKDPATYPGFDAALGASMQADLAAYVDSVVSQGDGEGSLAQLFSSNAAFVDARLAALYGVTGGPGVTRVALDPTTRRGVLTRAGFLTAHAAYDSSGPIARGVFVRSALLCAPPPPPPPNIPRTVAADGGRTTRERFAAHTDNPFCQGCHRAIDGVGFGFEQFDGIGRLRVVEGGEPVDTSGLLTDSGGPDAPFVGASALEDLLVASPNVWSCFVKQLFRFAMGRAETSDDRATLDRLGANFGAHRRITDLVLDLVADDAFVFRGRS